MNFLLTGQLLLCLLFSDIKTNNHAMVQLEKWAEYLFPPNSELQNQNETVEDSVSFFTFLHHTSSRKPKVYVQTAFQAQWGEVFKVYRSKFFQHILPSMWNKRWKVC